MTPTLDQLKAASDFTSEMLDLIDHVPDYTQSDLQGALDCVYMKYFQI